MRGEDIGSWDIRRVEQRMKIGNEVARGARHGDGGASAQMIRVKKRARAIIGANPRKLGNLRKHSAHSGLEWSAPDFGIIPVPGLEDHRRATRAAALEVHLAPISDRDQTGKITGCRGCKAALSAFWQRFAFGLSFLF